MGNLCAGAASKQKIDSKALLNMKSKKNQDDSDEEISKINMNSIYKKVAKQERKAMDQPGYCDLKQEDLVWMNSDISYINIALKTKLWVAGEVPTQADRDAFMHFKGRKIDEQIHPKAFAWFNKMSDFSEEEMNGWPESCEEKAVEVVDADSATTVQDLLAVHDSQRKQLMELEMRQRFSYDVYATLTNAERKANLKILQMRDKIALEGIHNFTIKNYFRHKESMEKSQLYETLNAMPKGGNLHIHPSAAMPADAYVQLTYDERVYFNSSSNMIKVFPKHKNVEKGFVKCVELRKKNKDFDELIRSKIVLDPSQVDDKSPEGIWKSFQPVFSMIGGMHDYAPFYKTLLKAAFQSHIKQNVFIVEYRFMSGLYYNDDMVKLTLKEELQMNKEVLDEIRQEVPHFQFKLIFTSLKFAGKQMLQQQIDHLILGAELEDEGLRELIAPGLDMVGEEDSNNQINQFAQQIIDGNKKYRDLGNSEGIPPYFHAGETMKRRTFNLHDSILLGTKRIGHGFQLQCYPHLQEICKSKDICIEVCPLSNMILGYSNDLRNHPINVLLAKGVQVCINSDDPTFFGYNGVSLDWAYATGGWQLDLQDLKKLSLNGIRYSTVSEDVKQELYTVFNEKWAEWIDLVNQDSFQ